MIGVADDTYGENICAVACPMAGTTEHTREHNPPISRAPTQKTTVAGTLPRLTR